MLQAVLNLLIISSFSAERLLSSILLNEVGRGWELRVMQRSLHVLCFWLSLCNFNDWTLNCVDPFTKCVLPATDGLHVLQYTHTMACPSYRNHGNCTSHCCWKLYFFSPLPPAFFANLSLSSSEEESEILVASSANPSPPPPTTVGVQWIRKLTVRIVSLFLSHGSDHFRINNNNKDNKTTCDFVTLNKIFKCVKTKNKVKN